ncbi:MAG: recombinase family protein, partial [Alphaproteobacteria bacterium]|nr:recombinase family protein [Alphaproteobacteria bacterium]
MSPTSSRAVTTRAVIYARYSSDNQRDASIEDQLRLCRLRLEREGWEPAGEFFDRAISGASMVRPGLQQLLERARAGCFDVVVCEALDRLSRDQADVAQIYKQLKFDGVAIVTLSEGPVSELHVGLKGTMNALFLKDLADKTRRGLRGRVEEGCSGGGNSYGYDVVKAVDANGEPDRGQRTINPGQAAVIQRVFELFAVGHSPRSIAQVLNNEGVPGPSGGLWRDTTIRGHITRGTGLLNNELYVGRLVWNRQRYIKDPTSGRRVSRINDPGELIVKDVPELRIVDDALWDRVKARQAGIRTSEPVKKLRESRFWERRRAKHLLTGMVFCASCGDAFASLGQDYLGCSRARSSKSCANTQSIRRSELEGRILDALKCNLMAPGQVEVFIAEFHAEVERQRRVDVVAHTAHHKDLAAVERKLDGLYDAIADGLRTTGLKAKVEALELEKARLEKVIATAPAPTPVLHPNLARLYAARIADLQAALQTEGLRTEALDILRGLIERVDIGPKAEDGSRPVELIGAIAGMIEAAHSKTPACGGAGVLGSFASSAKVVAGAGFEPATFRL